MMGYIVVDVAELSFIRKPFFWSVFFGGRARSVHISKTSGLSHLNSRFTGAHYHTSLKVCIMVSSVSPGTKAMQGSWRIRLQALHPEKSRSSPFPGMLNACRNSSPGFGCVVSVREEV